MGHHSRAVSGKFTSARRAIGRGVLQERETGQPTRHLLLKLWRHNTSEPLMTTTQASRRPLHGLVVGISVSESENLAAWGYTSADVNRVTLRLSEALLAAGAR